MSSKIITDPELHLISILAKHWISPSQQFENAENTRRTALKDSLRCWSSLELPAQNSINQIEAPAETSPLNEPKVLTQPPRTLPDVHYSSQRNEYQGALKNNDVVKALLNFHSRARLGGGGSAPLSGFRQLKPQTIPAQQKAGVPRIFRPRGN